MPFVLSCGRADLIDHRGKRNAISMGESVLSNLLFRKSERRRCGKGHKKSARGTSGAPRAAE